MTFADQAARQVDSRRVFVIAGPAMLANLTTPLLGVVSTGAIGQLGDAALLGGVALASVAFDCVFWLFGFLRMATVAFTAQALGANDRIEIRAVLIRALRVEEGRETVAARRPGVGAADWTSGPARLCKALGIDGHLNGADLTSPASALWIEPAAPVPDALVRVGPRVGLPNVPEPWHSIPWRFRLSEEEKQT